MCFHLSFFDHFVIIPSPTDRLSLYPASRFHRTYLYSLRAPNRNQRNTCTFDISLEHPFQGRRFFLDCRSRRGRYR